MQSMRAFPPGGRLTLRLSIVRKSMESNVPIYLFNQPRMKTLLVQKWQELMRLRVIREPIGGMTRHYMGGSNSPSIFQTTRRTSYVLRYVNPAQLTFARTKCTARLTARRQI